MTIEEVDSSELARALQFWSQYHESVEVQTSQGHIRLTEEEIVAELKKRGLLK
jgi:hypothetical protein